MSNPNRDPSSRGGEPTDEELDLRAQELRKDGIVGGVDLSDPSIDLSGLAGAMLGGVVKKPDGEIEEVDLTDRSPLGKKNPNSK